MFILTDLIPTGLNYSVQKHVLPFRQPSGTSRGILTEKKCWIISLFHQDITGLGECSIIAGLSPDYQNDELYERQLNHFLEALILNQLDEAQLDQYPSIRFGIETALLDIKHGGKRIYFKNDFTVGKRQIPINGLIWMGDEAFMQDQIEEKLATGYQCIKMKVGAIDFEKELQLLRQIRKNYSADKITLRVDANGAFSMDDAINKLEKLAELEIHSIEQPIKEGQVNAMKKLCATTPLPIALDEELITIQGYSKKLALLNTIRPQYIILKPSLHGGIKGTQEWIEIAEELSIPWWMTSALESNIGLTAIAQLAGEYSNTLPQGLGTGSLYVENFPSKLHVEKGMIYQII